MEDETTGGVPAVGKRARWNTHDSIQGNSLAPLFSWLGGHTKVHRAGAANLFQSECELLLGLPLAL
jgi:hypothetical protein